MIISSIERVEIKPNVFTYGRKYSWGTCNIENPEHSDFPMLYSLLIGHFSLECIKLADYFYNDYIEKLKLKRRKRKTREDDVLKTTI